MGYLWRGVLEKCCNKQAAKILSRTLGKKIENCCHRTFTSIVAWTLSPSWWPFWMLCSHSDPTCTLWQMFEGHPGGRTISVFLLLVKTRSPPIQIRPHRSLRCLPWSWLELLVCLARPTWSHPSTFWHFQEILGYRRRHRSGICQRLKICPSLRLQGFHRRWCL